MRDLDFCTMFSIQCIRCTMYIAHTAAGNRPNFVTKVHRAIYNHSEYADLCGEQVPFFSKLFRRSLESSRTFRRQSFLSEPFEYFAGRVQIGSLNYWLLDQPDYPKMPFIFGASDTLSTNLNSLCRLYARLRSC